jgi:hypothetical protein
MVNSINGGAETIRAAGELYLPNSPPRRRAISPQCLARFTPIQREKIVAETEGAPAHGEPQRGLDKGHNLKKYGDQAARGCGRLH